MKKVQFFMSLKIGIKFREIDFNILAMAIVVCLGDDGLYNANSH